MALAAVLCVGVGASAGSVALAQSGGQAAGRSDADIQSDVAYAISHSRSLKGQAITAATVEGDVTLSGNVKDDASKELAESVAYRVNGVRSVANNLTVGAGTESQAASGQDQAQSTDANSSNQPQDPGYDPAQQNMAQIGPEDQAQSQGAPPEEAQGVPYPSQPAPRQPMPPPQAGAPIGQEQATSGPVTVPAGTLLQVRTSEPLDANRLQAGAQFQATAAVDVYQGGVLAIPRGAGLQGRVVDTKTNQGALAGKQGLALQLTSLNLGGQSYALTSDTWAGQGPGKGGYSASNTIGGAGIGAIIGGIAGGGVGAAVGAGVGGAVGAAASAGTTGPRMVLPPEAVLNFHLTAPITVTPVSAQEAQRLASSQPRLQGRSPYGYAYGYPPPPPPPGYYYYGYRYYRPYPAYYRPGYYYGPGYYYRY